jgi:hypothetical protein
MNSTDVKKLKQKKHTNAINQDIIDDTLNTPDKIDSIKEQIKSNTIFIQITTMQLLGKSLNNDLHTKDIQQSLNHIKDAKEMVTLLQQLISIP